MAACWSSPAQVTTAELHLGLRSTTSSKVGKLLSEDADRLLPLYPRMHVLPGGEVACLGNGQDLIFYNPDTQTWREIGDAVITPHGDDDLTVLLGPAQAAKILHTCGGAVDDSGQELGVVDDNTTPT
jgi:hypothetical protein